MSLLDDIEARLDQYAVARIVGSPTTSTGMADSFNSSGGSPALNQHLSDDGAGWDSKVSTGVAIISTADNRVIVPLTTGTPEPKPHYTAMGSTDSISDYLTVWVDCYHPPQIQDSLLLGYHPYDLWMGVAAWLSSTQSSGSLTTLPAGVLLALISPTTDNTAASTSLGLYFMDLRDGVATSSGAVTLSTGLSVDTSSGYRLGMDLAGVAVTPWYEPLGGATGSRTNFATQYLTTDRRDGNHRRHGFIGRAFSNSTDTTGTPDRPKFDNFRLQPYSSDPVWFLTKSYMPPDGDRVMSIYETGGAPAEPKAPINYPTFQVRARAGSTGYSTASEKLALAETALHGFTGTVNSWYYAGVWAQSAPIPIGFDPQDTRPVVAQNFRAARSRTS